MRKSKKSKYIYFSCHQFTFLKVIMSVNIYIKNAYKDKGGKMSKKIRTLTSIIIVVMVLTFSTTISFGSIGVASSSIDRAENYISASAGLSFSGNTATARGTIKGISKTTKTKIHLYLQRLEGSRWVNVGDWQIEKNEPNLSLIKVLRLAQAINIEQRQFAPHMLGRQLKM